MRLHSTGAGGRVFRRRPWKSMAGWHWRQQGSYRGSKAFQKAQGRKKNEGKIIVACGGAVTMVGRSGSRDRPDRASRGEPTLPTSCRCRATLSYRVSGRQWACRVLQRTGSERASIGRNQYYTDLVHAMVTENRRTKMQDTAEMASFFFLVRMHDKAGPVWQIAVDGRLPTGKWQGWEGTLPL